MKTSLYSLLLIFAVIDVTAQSALDTLLAGERNYQVIRNAVEQQYQDVRNGAPKPKGPPKYKHWARYSSWLSTHLDADGNCVNVAEYDWRNRKLFSDNTNQRSAFANWSFVGPSNTTGSSKGLGRADRIAFHPTDANTIYIGTPAGGLWRTTNGGSSWSHLSDYLPSLGVSGIIVDYTNPNTLFILTGTGDGNGFSSLYNYRQASVGVLKSTDAGQSWQEVGAFPDTGDNPFFGYRLAQSPFDPDFFLAATNVGLYRSLDHGNTWTKISGGQFYDIAFKHTGNKVFVTKGPSASACFFSEDSGNYWEPITFTGQAPSASGRWEIETTPGEPCRFYLLCGAGDPESETFNGLYQSTNCGTSFAFINDSPNVFGSLAISEEGDQSYYDMAMAVNPNTNEGDKIVMGGLVTYRSLDNGLNISELTDYWEDSNDPESYIHPDVHDLAYNPLDDKLYAATDGGVYVSTDDGDTWSNISEGLQTTMIYNMAGTDLNDERLLIGTQDNGVQFRDGETGVFDFLATGDGFSVQFSPTNSGNGFCTINSTVYKTSNLHQTFTDITPDQINSEDHFFPRILAHNTDPNKLICSYYAALYSNNGGASWTQPDIDDIGRGFHALVSSPSNDNRVYAAGAVQYNDDYSLIYRSDNFGVTWTYVGNNSGYPPDNPRVTGIAVYPGLSTNVWVSFGNYIDNQKVYFSSDAGASWSNMTADLPNIVVNCIAVDGNNGAYIGTDQGVFYRNIFSDGWTQFSNKLPRVPVASLVINADQGIIRAGTYGRGIWETQLYSPCVQNITVTEHQRGDYFFQADNSISISSKQLGGFSTGGYLKSGHHIELLPGFETFSNQILRANIDECGTGGLPD